MLPGHVDSLAVGFRCGADAVAQVFWDRRRQADSADRDLAWSTCSCPCSSDISARHTRRTCRPLSVQERRVMMRVATGLSNAEVAASLFLSPGTVSKHLENSIASSV